MSNLSKKTKEQQQKHRLYLFEKHQTPGHMNKKQKPNNFQKKRREKKLGAHILMQRNPEPRTKTRNQEPDKNQEPRIKNQEATRNKKPRTKNQEANQEPGTKNQEPKFEKIETRKKQHKKCREHHLQKHVCDTVLKTSNAKYCSQVCEQLKTNGCVRKAREKRTQKQKQSKH